MRTYLLLTVALLGLMLNACDQKKAQKEHYLKLYSVAMGDRNFNVAMQAAYNWYTLDTNNVEAKDTLFLLFHRTRNFALAAKYGEQLMPLRPNDTTLLGRMADATRNTGKFDQAFTHYAKLFELTSDINYKYEMAIMQVSLKNYPEGARLLQELAQNPAVESKTIIIPIDGGASAQQVRLAAAVLNAMGFIIQENGNPAEALKLYERALEIEPKFLFPRNNIEAMKAAAGKK
jgi:tetratricopeptide (TPR) repeat protein